MALIIVNRPAHAGTPDADLFDTVADGFQGPTQLFGGRGNDTYVLFGNSPAVVEENAGEGTDTILLTASRTSFVLAANVERFGFTSAFLFGPAPAASGSVREFTGNDLDNFIEYGANGTDDEIDGGLGRDTMAAGGGDDTYAVDNTGDVVVEAGAGGLDTVRTTVAFTLALNVENMVVLAAVAGTGNALDNVMDGSAGAQVLSGLAGNDALSGGDGNDRLSGGDGNDSLVGDAGDDSLDGGAGSDALEGNAGRDTLAGGAGGDVYLIDGADDALDVITEAAGAPGGSDLVIVRNLATYTTPANVERLRMEGAGPFNAIGNALDNHISTGSGNDTLQGANGNDVLEGGAGNDSMLGGAGDDTYVVESVADRVVEATGGGTDTVLSTVSLVLGDAVENLVLVADAVAALSAIGNASANVLTGNEYGNFLQGLAGNDLLDGRAGMDRMHGGLGDDTFVVDNAGDMVGELVAQGTDTVRSRVSFVLPDNVENLVLTGGALDGLAGTGNARANVLTGDAGANRLEGGGGNDRLIGGAGNDSYLVESTEDVVVELPGDGRDLAMVLTQGTLAANVEDGLLLGGGFELSGNMLDNVLSGNAGFNTLRGGQGSDRLFGMGGEDNLLGEAGDDLLDGGRGFDSLTGGIGNDTYVLDALDTLNELPAQGTDLVRAVDILSLDLAQVANPASGLRNVENVELLGVSRDVLGNALNNVILGNALANSLSGGAGNDSLAGGAGNDTLSGGAGNDTFVVGEAGDRVVDTDITAAGGLDLVQSSVSFALDDGDSAGVEAVLAVAGAGAINLTGNARANTLTGNAAANLLSGGGANDTLAGGDGADRLDVAAALDALEGAGGNDSLAGGAGDDAYGVDSRLDVVTEAAGGGTDTVVVDIGDGTGAAVTYALSANVERGILLGGNNVNRLDGNALDNALFGNGAGNILNGLVGNDLLDGDGTTLGGIAQAADTMTGGGGDDTYVVNDSGDVVTEAASGGIDEILLNANFTGNYTLNAAGRLEVENLTIVSAGGGEVLTGNALANRFTVETATAVSLSGLGGDDSARFEGVSAGNIGFDGGTGVDRVSARVIDGSIGLDVDAVERVELQLEDGGGGASVNFANSSAASVGQQTVIAFAGGATVTPSAITNLLPSMTRFEMLDSNASVLLSYAGTAPTAVSLRLEDAGDATVPVAAGFGVTTALQRLDITGDVGTSNANLLELLGSTINTVGVSGAGNVGLLGVIDSQDFEVTGFSAQTLGLDVAVGASSVAVAVGNSSFDLFLDSDVTALALSVLTVASPSQVSILESFAPTLAVDLAAASDPETLQLTVGSIASVNADDYRGVLIFEGRSEDGAGITFVNTVDKDDPDAVDEYSILQNFWSLSFGDGDDVIQMGNNLWTDTRIDGGGVAVTDQDVLQASVNGLDTRVGQLHIRNVERLELGVTLPGGAGTPSGLVDGSFIEDDEDGTALVLTGGIGTFVVLDHMRVSEIDADAFAGGLEVFLRDAMGAEDPDLEMEVTGGSGNDTLVGASGDDVFAGGDGSDVLTGGTGADVFVFDGATGADTITDFETGLDRLAFEGAEYAVIAGGITADNFRIGAAAVDGNDFVLYDPATGTLRFDADGSAGGEQVLAQLVPGTTVALGDLLVL